MGGSKGLSMRGAGMERLLDDPEIIAEIGITQTQIDKLRSLKMEATKSQIRNSAEVKILKLDFEDLLNQDNPDVKKIDAKIDEMGKLEIEMKKSMVHSIIEMKSILTDEQLEKLQELIKERMKERMENRRDNRGDRGDRGRKQGDRQGRGGPGMEFDFLEPDDND